jgi:tRNA U55 pseudouridine synthase TruB
MSALERTAVGGFHVHDAVPAGELTFESVAKHLQPPLTAVPELPKLTLDAAQLNDIRFGRSIAVPSDIPEGMQANAVREWAGVTPSGELATILRETPTGQLRPCRTFLAAL